MFPPSNPAPAVIWLFKIRKLAPESIVILPPLLFGADVVIELLRASRIEWSACKSISPARPTSTGEEQLTDAPLSKEILPEWIFMLPPSLGPSVSDEIKEPFSNRREPATSNVIAPPRPVPVVNAVITDGS